jgi:hypothetical protein
MSQRVSRTLAACACLTGLLAAPWSQGAEIPAAWKPSAVFEQAGAGREVASVALGASWTGSGTTTPRMRASPAPPKS